MFCIMTKSIRETLQVLLLLSEWDVCTKKQGNINYPDGSIVVVDTNSNIKNVAHREGELQQAEWVFMQEYYQVGRACPVCMFENTDKNPSDIICGHLTFCGRKHG